MNLGHQLQNVDQVFKVVCHKCFHCCPAAILSRIKFLLSNVFGLRFLFLMLPTQGISREHNMKANLTGWQLGRD